MTNGVYAAHGAPSGYTYGNNVWPFLVYNNRLQPNQLYALKNNDTNQYLYYFWLNWGGASNNGTLQQVDEEVFSSPAPYNGLTVYGQNYGYDNVNRLISASDATGANTNWSRSFAYDAFGNGWLSGTPVGIGYGPATPAGNVYVSTVNGKTVYLNQIGSSPYDGEGNMTSMPPAYTMSYDAENRQITVSNSGNLAASYVYDGLGQRVAKVASGQTTTYVYDAFGSLAAEYTAANSNAPCATCYLNYDHLGSLRLVTDGSGNIIARHDFLPFGEEIPGGAAGRSSQFGPTLDNLTQRFTGQERDPESLFDWFKTRYANAGLMGRFLSPDRAGMAAADPANPQSWNQYAYVSNNPLNAIDPSGMACYPLEKKLTGGCGPQEGVDFGSSWNEFNAIETAFTPTAYLVYIEEFDEGRNPNFGMVYFEPVYGNADMSPITFSATSFGLPWIDPVNVSLDTKLLPPKNGTHQLYCQPDIIQAMKGIWRQSGNGTSGAEASFRVDGSLTNYRIVPQPFTNQSHSQTLTIIPGTTFALFHVHPNTSGWQPSTPGNNYEGNRFGDTGYADKYNFQTYVVSRKGLGMYDPATRTSSLLRPNLDWTKPCH